MFIHWDFAWMMNVGECASRMYTVCLFKDWVIEQSLFVLFGGILVQNLMLKMYGIYYLTLASIFDKFYGSTSKSVS